MKYILSNSNESGSEDSFRIQSTPVIFFYIQISVFILSVYLVVRSFPEKSLFKISFEDLNKTANYVFLIIIIMLYAFAAITLKQGFDSLNAKVFIIDVQSKVIKIKNRFVGEVVIENFDNISAIKFYSNYDSELSRFQKLSVILHLKNDTQITLVKGGNLRYKKFREFISKFSELESLIESEDIIF